jgi:predicted dehydrogenase
MSVKWGVIGAGGIADRRTIPEGIVPSPKCDLVAMMDLSAERASAVAAKYGVALSFTRYEDLLAIPEIEAVYIASPNCFHRAQVIAAARAGKHIFVEKPMALSVADAKEMMAACDQSGVKPMVGYLMRFHAGHQRLSQMIEAGELGQIVFGRAQLTCWYPAMEGALRQVPELGGGGAFIDMGTHCLDLLEVLIGKAKRLVAFMSTITQSYPVEDTGTIMVEFEGGAQGIVDVNFNVPDEAAQNVLEIRGTGGLVLADHTIGQEPVGPMTAYIPAAVGGYDAAQERGEAGIARPIEYEPVNTYQAEVEHFVDCIEQDLAPITGGAEALRFVRLTELVYESAATGKVIML